MNFKVYPKVSTIINVYNGERYIAEAINSVINQEYSNMEIIVIDDGSTDKTKAIVQKFVPHVTYIYQENLGIASAKNNGIENATGDFFAFLDADDLWTKEKTTIQLNQLLKDASLDMVFSFIEQFYSPELSEEERKRYYFPEKPSPGIGSVTMIIRKESFNKVGLFNSQWRKGIFNDWYLRACEIGLKSEVNPEVFAKRRIHNNNHGIIHRDKSVDYVRMLKASLDRRRKIQTNK